MAGIEHKQVDNDEAGMRLDRWFKVHYPGLGFGQLQKLLRSGQVRIDGGRAKSDTRVQPGQTIRIPPMEVDAKAPKSGPIAGRDLKHSPDGELLAHLGLLIPMGLHEATQCNEMNGHGRDGQPAGYILPGHDVNERGDDANHRHRNPLCAG